MITFFISLMTTGAVVTGYHFLVKQPIGYVKTGIVLQKYEAMIEANKQYAMEVSVVKGNIDTLRNRYERLKAEAKYSAQKADWGYRLGIAEKEYLQYNESAQQQLQQRQQQLTTNVLNTVNTFIQEYGKQHQYKIIFGTTTDGSILYGIEKDDLTEIVLSELNKNYKKNKTGNGSQN